MSEDLSKLTQSSNGKSSVATVSKPTAPEKNNQIIQSGKLNVTPVKSVSDLIDSKISVGFSEQLLNAVALGNSAELLAKSRDAAELQSFLTTLAEAIAVKEGEKKGKYKAQLKIKYDQLTELRNDANHWAANKFKSLLTQWCEMGLRFADIENFITQAASKVGLDLIVKISDDGSYTIPKQEFKHDAEIAKIEQELKTLGVI